MALTRAAVSKTIKALLPHVRLVKRGTGWALVREPDLETVATADSLREMADGVLLAFREYEADSRNAPQSPETAIPDVLTGEVEVSGG